MQAAAQMALAPVASRMQRPPASRLGSPAGLAPLGGKAFKLARRPPVAARAGLEDALSAAADAAPSALNNLAAHFSTALFVLGDAADAVAGAADALPDAAAEVSTKNDGFFGAFAGAFEAFLKVLDGNLEKIGVPYSYGFAIIFLTLLVKVATYPLTKQQVESTLSMQALAPRVKELQGKFANDPERLQMETAKLYQTAGVNPLAGCLPSLATIPVFIGLYKALSNVANEGLLTEGFFWIPSLAGPTTVNGGLGWLFKWEGGVPPLGFRDTACYLVLPILLVVSQFVSQKVISPAQQSNDPAQQQTQAILKFLPLMIGWFSLNVPSGLTLYWFTNNLVTTAQQLYLRRGFQAAQDAVAGPASGAVVDVVAQEVEKKPSGKELNARRSPKADDGRGEKFRAIKAREAALKASSQAAVPAAAPAAGESRGAKFRALKAQEAAAKAAAQAAPSSNGSAPAASAAQAEEPAAAVAVAEVEVVEEEGADSAVEEGQEQQHTAAGSSSGGSSARGKGGKKKGSKKK